MQAFEYASPTTLAEAFTLLAAGDAAVLAGGTDLISLMKDYIATPKRVVNIKGIHELGGISHPNGGGLRIGATVTFDELLNNAVVRNHLQAIHQAAAGVTSPQVRNMGTVGGDLCQRPRCWYYRNGFGLFAMKDGKSLVPEGENKYHAIFGGGPAYFVSASSLSPALIALNAKVTLKSQAGSRSVPVEKFFVTPADEQSREVDLKPDEILTEIVLPDMAGVKNATYEVRQREALDWPLVAASVALQMGGGRVKSARIVLGHVAATPWICADAAKSLEGQEVDAATAEKAGAAAVAGAKPLSQNGYKVQLAKVAVKRALLAAWKEA
ncbi:MAG TPA: xanthine dehydrogenase family protein subunit M [Bryobacteraceae bacterium]|nr:xanthine dehydrogenase family protein subunit M [Bryobacteraceae bacterium]